MRSTATNPSTATGVCYGDVASAAGSRSDGWMLWNAVKISPENNNRKRCKPLRQPLRRIQSVAHVTLSSHHATQNPLNRPPEKQTLIAKVH